MNKKLFIKLFVFTLAFLQAVIFFQPDNAYADTGVNLTVSIQQQFESDQENMTNIFKYQLKALDDNAPMPGGELVYGFAMKGSTIHEVAFSFNETGIYRYQLEQVIPENKETGYKYDSRKLTLEVHVYHNSDQRLTAILLVKNEQGQKLANIMFENAFKSQKLVAIPKDKGNLPQTGEEINFLLSIIGIGCTWFLLLSILFRKKYVYQEHEDI